MFKALVAYKKRNKAYEQTNLHFIALRRKASSVVKFTTFIFQFFVRRECAFMAFAQSFLMNFMKFSTRRAWRRATQIEQKKKFSMRIHQMKCLLKRSEEEVI